MISSGIASQLFARVGTRPIIVAGALVSAGAVYWLSRIPVDGSYVTDLLPGLVIMSFGLGFVFVGVNTAANAGVPAEKAGLAAALVNTSTWLGGALGLADLLRHRHHPHPAPSRRPREPVRRAHLRFRCALVACSAFLVAAALIALRATNTRGESAVPETAVPALEAA